MRVSDSILIALMARAQNGDAGAYRALLSSSESWLRGFFARRIAPHEVDDLVQETLISLHRKRATYDPARPFLPWLAAIARYRWVDRLRQTYRAATESFEGDLPVDSHEDVVAAQISIERLLAQIKPDQAHVIALVKIDGLSIAEAARKSGQSESLVKVNIHRGLKKLAALVESE
ncbi:MAG: sigma-70 family RNA polymerase sigma factor [Sphingopyxis sp.]